LGRESTHWQRQGRQTWSVRWATTSTMRRVLQEGQTPRPFAGQGHEALRSARVAADAGEAVGEDATAEVGAEVVLHPARHALAVGFRLGGLGQEGLEVVLDDGVERRGRGVAAPVDGGESIRSCGMWRVGKGSARSSPGRAGRRGGAHGAERAATAVGALPWCGRSWVGSIGGPLLALRYVARATSGPPFPARARALRGFDSAGRPSFTSESLTAGRDSLPRI
jgi:hypothetical protein